MSGRATSRLPVLGTRALNRALLARQHLLERSPMSADAMIGHLVGLQAQVPGDPYVALWSRLGAFRPADLSRAIEDRRLVRMGLMRTTLHLVTAPDAAAMWPVVHGVLERAWASAPFRKDVDGVDVAAVVAEGRAILDREALTLSELGKRLAVRWPDRPPNSLAYAVRFLAPIVQVPPRGLWQRTGQARWRTLHAWLDVPGPPPDASDAGPDELVLRYLRAFGPASARDVATWSWLTGVRDVVDRLRPRLRAFSDEAGAELLDVPDGPLPDPDTPAPPRFLPEYDNIALSHADRSRIVSPAAMGRLTGFVGTILLDGFVAGQWRLDRSKDATTLVLDPFVPLRSGIRDELTAEGERLLAWTAQDVPDGHVRRLEFGVARPVLPAARGPARGQWAPR